jgi:hypothetical protein
MPKTGNTHLAHYPVFRVATLRALFVCARTQLTLVTLNACIRDVTTLACRDLLPHARFAAVSDHGRNGQIRCRIKRAHLCL